MSFERRRWQHRIDELALEHRVPGAALLTEVTAREGQLVVRAEPTGGLVGFRRATEDTLVPVTDHVFAGRAGTHGRWTPDVFYTLPDGCPYLHVGMRANPKTGS